MSNFKRTKEKEKKAAKYEMNSHVLKYETEKCKYSILKTVTEFSGLWIGEHMLYSHLIIIHVYKIWPYKILHKFEMMFF